MRKQRFWLIWLAFASVVFLNACRTSAPTQTAEPSVLSSTPTTAAASQKIEATTSKSVVAPPQSSPAATVAPATPAHVPPTPTQAPATATPLPTWPPRWEPTGGPQGGVIEAVAIDTKDPNVLYAAGLGGAVYKSMDQGETWTSGERLVPPSCPFSSLVIDAENNHSVYAANLCAGIFKSSDGGTTWTQASGDIDGGIQLLAQSPHAPGLLLAADLDGNVYRSQDGALTWEPLGAGLPAKPVRGLGASGPETYWVTTTNGNDGTLYRFTAGIWSVVPFGQPQGTDATNVLVDPQDPATLFVGLEQAKDSDPQPASALLFRSTDGGLTWTPLPNVAPPADTGSKDVGPKTRVHLLGKGQLSGTLYVADSTGLLSSTDQGDTWQRVDLPAHASAIGDLQQMAIDAKDNGSLYLPLRSTGIAKSTDGGGEWSIKRNGLNSTLSGIITTHPTVPTTLYVTSGKDLSIFKTSNSGADWTRLDDSRREPPGARQVSALLVDPNQPNTIYQAVDTARVHRSDDGGVTWSAVWPSFRFSSIYGLAVAPSDPKILYANKNGFGLFRSDDAGETWRFLPSLGVDYTYALAIHPENTEFVLSGENRKPHDVAVELHRSKDGGATWDAPLTVTESTGITSVVFDPRVEPFFRRGAQPDDPTRLYAASVGSRGSLWFSNDAGDSWKPLNDDLNFTNVWTLAVAPHRPGVAYASPWGGGTWRTDDAGSSWRRLSGDPATSAIAIAIDPSNYNVVYIADGTTPHLYRSIDDGNSWELLFDAGADHDRLAALALAPSDPSIVYVSATRASDGEAAGTVFRIDTHAPAGEQASDVTGDLPGTPSSLAVHRHDPRRIFAALPGAGIWKTMDDGATWRQVKNGLTGQSFTQIVVDPIHPETLFVAAGRNFGTPASQTTGENSDDAHGIWKSTDDGNNWRKVGGATFGPASGPISTIAFQPGNDRVMYAAGQTGIYLSPDRGESWTDISGRLPPIPMPAVATDGQTLYAGTAGAGVFPGVIHPLIYTADWASGSQLTAPVHHIQITLHPDDPSTLYASAYPAGIFKTVDGGVTWSARSEGLPSFAVADPLRQGHYALAIAPGAPDVLYLGLFDQGVYRSDDGAATWRPVFGQDGELQGAGVQTLLVHPDDSDIVYVASDEGVWRTVNGGRTWSEFGPGLPPGGDVRTLVLGADDHLYAGSRGFGLYTRGAYHQAEEDGWRQLPEMGSWGTPSLSWGNRPLYQQTSLLVPTGDSNVLYAGAYPAGVFKTIDGGTTWREQNAGLKNDGVLTLVSSPADQGVLYAGMANGIARSIDGGVTWHPWDAGWPPHQRVSSIAIDPTNPDTLYACSTNGDALQPAPSVNGAAGGTVMKSTDGGATWFEITTGLESDQTFLAVLLDHFDPSTVYLATQNDGVFVSRDGGATWTSWNQGLWNRVAGGGDMNAKDVLQISADGRLLYLGTSGSGVWRRPAEGAP